MQTFSLWPFIAYIKLLSKLVSNLHAATSNLSLGHVLLTHQSIFVTRNQMLWHDCSMRITRTIMNLQLTIWSNLYSLHRATESCGRRWLWRSSERSLRGQWLRVSRLTEPMINERPRNGGQYTLPWLHLNDDSGHFSHWHWHDRD